MQEKEDIDDQITYFTRCKGWHDGLNFRYLLETSVQTSICVLFTVTRFTISKTRTGKIRENGQLPRHTWFAYVIHFFFISLDRSIRVLLLYSRMNESSHELAPTSIDTHYFCCVCPKNNNDKNLFFSLSACQSLTRTLT